MPNNTKIYLCPRCGGRLAHITMYQGITGVTRQGTIFADEFIKCELGCSKSEILPPPKLEPLPDMFFLEVLAAARANKKKISQPDMTRERNLFNRLRVIQ